MGQDDLGINQYQRNYPHDSDMNVASLFLLGALRCFSIIVFINLSNGDNSRASEAASTQRSHRNLRRSQPILRMLRHLYHQVWNCC